MRSGRWSGVPLLLAVAGLLSLPLPVAAATDPAASGPFTAGLRTLPVPGTAGNLTTDVHYPRDAGGGIDPAAGRCPLLVMGHGFSSNKDVHANQGAHWASRGYITLIPNLTGFSDHSRNADDLVALVSWALAESQDPASWLYDRIDPRAIGSTGHSAGGLSSLVAAARDPRIRATAPLDPVDNADLGANAMASITAPVAITWSEDSPCNANGSARALYAAAVPIKRGVKIVGANHCDPLDPSNFGCELVCGGADAIRQERYRRYVTGWFEYWLRCDPSYYEWVYGSRPAADLAAGTITWAADPDPGPLEPCAQTGVPPGEVQRLLAWRSGGSVSLSWDPVTASPPVSGYRVYRATDLPFVYGPPIATPAGAAGDDPGGVGGAALYFYRVRAVNSAGEGP